MDSELETLQAEIDSLRSQYGEVREILTRALGTVYRDPETAVMSMMSKSDEFGPQVAAEQLVADPSFMVCWKETTTDELFASQADPIGDLLERAVELHDRLDTATGSREERLRAADPGRPLHMHFQGEEYQIDLERLEARSIGEPDKVKSLIKEEVRMASDGMTLTERFARDMGAPKAEPDPSRARNRER